MDNVLIYVCIFSCCMDMMWYFQVVKFDTYYFLKRKGLDNHDDVVKWKHVPRYWPFVRGIHRSPVNSPHKGQWRGALMFSLIGAWLTGWVTNREAGDLRRHRVHYDVIVMMTSNDFGESRCYGKVSDTTRANILTTMCSPKHMYRSYRPPS